MGKSKKRTRRSSEHIERKPLVQEFDADGNLIGDDGYELTPARKRMHFIFDAFFVVGLIAAIVCLACIVISYFQGQDYSYIELQATGGTLVNGWELALLLRVEALYCLSLAIVLISSNIIGFHWLYERGSAKKVLILLGFEAVVSLGVALFFIGWVHFIEPVSFVCFFLICYSFFCMKRVEVERPHLKKPKVASRVVKK